MEPLCGEPHAAGFAFSLRSVAAPCNAVLRLVMNVVVVASVLESWAQKHARPALLLSRVSSWPNLWQFVLGGLPHHHLGFETSYGSAGSLMPQHHMGLSFLCVMVSGLSGNTPPLSVLLFLLDGFVAEFANSCNRGAIYSVFSKGVLSRERQRI